MEKSTRNNIFNSQEIIKPPAAPHKKNKMQNTVKDIGPSASVSVSLSLPPQQLLASLPNYWTYNSLL
jgi:hypothetical protein